MENVENKNKCKACKSELAIGAYKCLACGADQRNWFLRHKVITGILCLILFNFVSSIVVGIINGINAKETFQADTPVRNQSPSEDFTNKVIENPLDGTVEISADKLISDYMANEVSADTRYKGKLLRITGAVDAIKKDFSDIPYIQIKSTELFRGVDCKFAPENVAELSRISKGQIVVIEGKCDGLSVDVRLKSCKIVYERQQGDIS